MVKFDRHLTQWVVEVSYMKTYRYTDMYSTDNRSSTTNDMNKLVLRTFMDDLKQHGSISLRDVQQDSGRLTYGKAISNIRAK